MAQDLKLKIAGLHVSSNDLGSVPEGALTVADNIDIAQEDVAQPRRGLNRHLGEYEGIPKRIFSYNNITYLHILEEVETEVEEETVTTVVGKIYKHDPEHGWVFVMDAEAPEDCRIQTLSANQNLFFTTSKGVYKMDTTPSLAGVPKALGLELALVNSSGFLSDKFRVSYQLLFAKKDKANNLILGAPSSPVDIKNTANASRDVKITTLIPVGIDESFSYQLYRSTQEDNTSADIYNNSELQLVFEGSVTGTDITNGYIEITDITPDALRGALIYTAASQEGAVMQNEQPPLCKDFTTFRNVTFYANTVSRSRFTLTLLAVGGSNGLQLDDTITLGSVTYTAKAAEDLAENEFQLFTSGSASQNIKDTCYSLIRCINNGIDDVYGYYMQANPNDLPGKILLEKRELDSGDFIVNVSRPSTFSPSGIPVSDINYKSTSDRFQNGVSWSKPNQPEHVALPNQTRIGNADAEIYKITALRDHIIVEKTDGFWKISGDYPNFQVELLDNSAIPTGRYTSTILNNQILSLTNQGVVSVINDVGIISQPTDTVFKDLLAETPMGVKNLGFSVGYEDERKLMLFLPSRLEDTTATQCYVFNTFTNKWTRHLYNVHTASIVGQNLVLAESGRNYLRKDRKSNTYLDNSDYELTTEITEIDGDCLTLIDSVEYISVGDVIWQNSQAYGIVTEVDRINSQVYLHSTSGFSTDYCDLLKAIPTKMTWAPVTVGNPGISKQLHTATLFFKRVFQGNATLGFTTDLSSFLETVPLEGEFVGTWGMFPWGNAPWGGVVSSKPIRQWIPRNKQTSSQMTFSFSHSTAHSNWLLTGVSFFGAAGSEKVNK